MSRKSRTKVLTFNASDTECDHPNETLRYVGADGKNSYYECVRCEAVFVSQDDLVRMAQDLENYGSGQPG